MGAGPPGWLFRSDPDDNDSDVYPEVKSEYQSFAPVSEGRTRRFSYDATREKMSDFLGALSPYTVELCGTLLLGLVSRFPCGELAPWGPVAYAAALTALTLVGFQRSGAHYNPAVTLAMHYCNKISPRLALGYIAAQIVGGLLAGLLTYPMTTGQLPAAPGEVCQAFPSFRPGLSSLQALLCESLFSMLWIKIALDGAERKRMLSNERVRSDADQDVFNYSGQGNTVSSEATYVGLGLCMAVTAGGVSVRRLTGAIFNPAIATGLLVAHGRLDGLWVYCVGPLLAALVASWLWRLTAECTWASGGTVGASAYSPRLGGLLPFNRQRIGGLSPGEGADALPPLVQITAPYLLEFVGTFYFCFVVGVTRWTGVDMALMPLAIGGIAVSGAYTVDQASMALFNPSTSIAALASGLFRKRHTDDLDESELVTFGVSVLAAALYITSQIFASFCAAWAIVYAVGAQLTYPQSQSVLTWKDHLVGETLFGFLLGYVVLLAYWSTVSSGRSHREIFLVDASSARKTRWYQYSLASGFAYLTGTIVVGSVSGAALNPAVATALLVTSPDQRGLFIFWVGPTLGGLLAAVLFKLTLSRKEIAGSSV